MSCRLFSTTVLRGTVTLSPEESHHATTALRARVGDAVELFDGAGQTGAGVITHVDRSATQVQVESVDRVPFDFPVQVTLAIALPRTHRQGYLIEKCTELGVAAIWPIITHRSVAKPSAAAVMKLSRRAIEAAKQSGRTWVPKIAGPMTFEESASQAKGFDAVSMAVLDSAHQPFGAFLSGVKADASVLVWIGPEGGWTEDEVRCATASRAVPTRLGPTVLRTETAAVAVCAAVAHLACRPSGHESSRKENP